MTDKPASGKSERATLPDKAARTGTSKADDRESRLAEALRANLRRRKVAARIARSDDD